MRSVVASVAYWGPLAIGVGATAILFQHGAKPLGVAMVLVPPALGAVLLVPPFGAVWFARVVVAAQAFFGAFITSMLIVMQAHPPYVAFEGQRMPVMPTEQLALAMVAALVLTAAWLRVPEPRTRPCVERGRVARHLGCGDGVAHRDLSAASGSSSAE